MYMVTDAILQNNARLDAKNIQRLLIVHYDDEFYLGDNCIIFHRLGLCKDFFSANARLEINFVNPAYSERYQDLCKNNPSFDAVACKPLNEIDGNAYDALLFIAPGEQIFAEWVSTFEAPSFAAFSFSKAVFARRENIQAPIFPFFEELFRHVDAISDQPYELYISEEEKAWGEYWLSLNGVNPDDNVLIVADYTSRRFKLIRQEVYRSILLHLLEKENSLILIFDETDMGKEKFYINWFGEKYISRFIFATGLSLREAFCIVAASQVRLVFGPCTGLLHCASAIYNKFLRDGLDAAKVPVMITYTGPWDAYYWWKNSPLVDCLLVQEANGHKKMYALKDLDEAAQKDWEQRLPCSEYSPGMLTAFIDSRLSLYTPVC